MHAQLTVGQDSHEQGHQVGVDDALNLSLRAGRDVGQGPGGLLLHANLVVSEQSVEDGQAVGLDHALSLIVRAGHNVADASQGRAQNANLIIWNYYFQILNVRNFVEQN